MRNLKFTLFTLFTCFVLSFPITVQSQPKKEKKKIEASRKLVIEGDKFFREKNYREAIKKYSEAIAVLPNNPYAHYSKGYSHYNLGEYDQAIIDFSTALEQGYRPLDVYTVRWQAYYWRKDYDLALKDIQAALQIQPSSAYFNLAAGDVYRAKQDFRNALQHYTRATELDDTKPDIYFYIAVCYNALGEYTQQGIAALQALKKGTRYRAESWVYVGQAAQLLRKYEEASQAYEKALQEKPDLKLVYFNLAETYRVLGDYDQAIATLKRGLNLYQNDGSFYISLSRVYSLSDRHQDAAAAAQIATKLLPNEQMGYTNLCRAYNDLKQYNQAIEACKKALELRPNDGETHFYLARAYDSLKNKALADASYQKAVEGLLEYTQKNPYDSDGFYLLGNAYFAIDQPSRAIEAYKKCIELAPKFAKARYNLGYVYAATGNKQLAREQYIALLDLNPTLASRLLDAINKL